MRLLRSLALPCHRRRELVLVLALDLRGRTLYRLRPCSAMRIKARRDMIVRSQEFSRPML